jgi:hypothetical protein
MIVDKKLVLYLSLGFILATVAGTLSHEWGHYMVARSLGYKVAINYASTYLTEGPYPTPAHLFRITLGGPVQTMLTGTVGLLLLFLFRKSFQSRQQLSFPQWGLIFITLFWLRQTANLAVGLGIFLFKGRLSESGDEVELARHWHLPGETISIITGLLGAVVLAIVIFTFIPARQRLTFVIAGLAGGVAGYLLWLKWLGPVIMP